MKTFITSVKKHKIFSGLIFLVLIVIVFFLIIPKIKEIRADPLAKYETIKVKREDLTQTVSASGEIKAEKEAVLRFQTSGQLAWVGVKKGDKVKAWQAIASLDKRELEMDLKKKLLAYMNERWDFEQTRDDYPNEGVLTDSEKRILEKAQFDLDSTVVDVEIRHLAKELATLVTPISGIVTEIESPVPGVNITPATAEFIIADPSKMKFVASVDETDIGQVSVGQKAKVTLDAYPNEEFEGVVEKIAFSSITTRGGGTAFEVEISLPENKNEKFKIGLNGDVEIIISEKKNVFALPFEALKTKKGKTYVQIIEGRKIKEIEVKKGIEQETKVEIIEGLSQNQVVVKGKKE